MSKLNLAQLDQNDLYNMIDDVAWEWGEFLSYSPFLSPITVDGIVFVGELNPLKGTYLLSDDGKIFESHVNTIKTGDVIWNGDDEYFNAVKHEWTLGEEIYTIESYDDLENLACQIVASFQ